MRQSYSSTAAGVLGGCLLLFAAGCSLIRIEERPDPLDDVSGSYGKIVRDIRVEGIGYTHPSVVTRALVTEAGQPYTREAARQDYAYLDRLRIFSGIDFVPVEEGPDSLTLLVDVLENAPYLPSISLELSQENGLSIGPGVTSGNLFGRAMKLSGFARFGGATNAQLRFRTPFYPGSTPQVNADYYNRWRQNKLDDFDEKATELYVLVQRSLGRHARAGIRLDYLSIGSDVPGITLSPDNRDNLPGFGFSLGYDSRNLWSDPTTGWDVTLDAMQYGGALGGDGDFERFNLDVRRYVPLGRRHTLALSSLFTYTTGDVGVDVPVWADYHIGGTNSVRGWELGARNGKNQLLGTLEYRYLLVPPKVVSLWFIRMDIGLQVALIGDVGTAWNRRAEFRDHFIGGVGAGLRLLLPSVDMLRFDVAVGERGAGIQLHIGGWDKATAQRGRVR